ncbi:MAG: type II toxin-antitoxin system VapC family toxin [Candidatus Dormibacteria bacterium]
MTVLDATVLIAHFNAHDAHHSKGTAVLDLLAHEALRVSPLTMAEVLVAPARQGKLQVAVRALRDLDVQQTMFDQSTPLELASLRAQTGLRLPDCAVLAAARTERAAVATFDSQLRSAAIQLELDVVN